MLALFAKALGVSIFSEPERHDIYPEKQILLSDAISGFISRFSTVIRTYVHWHVCFIANRHKPVYTYTILLTYFHLTTG